MAMTFRNYSTKYKGMTVSTGSLIDLEFLYIKERLSTTQISNLFEGKISNKTIARRLKQFGIQARDNKGENNPSWNGGVKITKDGYKLIHKPDHPFRNSQGYVLEHRLVMEDHLGRYLTPEEVVHHEDKNRLNNDIDNLTLTSGHSEHAKIENEFRERDSYGRYI